jgi:hypothetical protein
MKKVKYYLPIISIMFFFGTHFAHAGFEITEIMYDLDGTDTDREWVEAQNTGGDPADLSKWYLFSDNSKHTLTPQGGATVSAGGYAIIAQNPAKFQADQPGFSGLIFDSSWTGINNSGDTIGLKDPDLNLVSSATFTSGQGGAGDGNTIQKINGIWSGGHPTPGAANQASSSSTGDSTSTTTDQNSTSTITSTKKEKVVEDAVLKTSIISPKTVFAGLPFQIDSLTTGHKKEPVIIGRYSWNFGDGQNLEAYNQREFSYIYAYPGQYALTLSYYNNIYDTIPEATDRLIIKVIPPEVSISSIGAGSDPFIELENKSPNEVDLSKWIIKTNLHSFVIPPGTIFLPSQKLKFSPKITYFSYQDMPNMILVNSSGDIAATYPATLTATTSNRRVSGSSSDRAASNSRDVTDSPSQSNIIDLNDLSASAAKTNALNPSFAWIGLIGVIIIGLATAMLMKRKMTPADNLGIIRAEDMTIIE